jgi:hypothetical protein
MGQNQHRATEVAKILSRFIKADLAEDLSLAMIKRKFPGMSGEEFLRVLAICQDEATLEYERSQELVASMRETTAGHAALLAIVDLWRSQSEEHRRMIGRVSSELANTPDKLQAQWAASSRHKGWELLANLTSQDPHQCGRDDPRV